jgi:prepilin-type N-terminal cleavage/methylation domain-containing protein
MMNLQTQNKNGFTLIEMLVVIGLTAVVLALFIEPLIQAMGFTHRTQTSVAAQDNARIALAQVSKDLSDAIYVYDNTHAPINFPMAAEDGTVWTDSNGNAPQALYAKIDMVLPRMKCYCTSTKHPAGVTRETDRAAASTANQKIESPTEAAPLCQYDHSVLELRPVQPTVPDTTIVRYFVGLADPSSPYVNPYPFDANAPKNTIPTKGMTGITSVATGDPITTNTYVLYRVEFSPTDPNLFPKYKTNSSGQQVLRTLNDNLSDPNFFYNTATNSNTYVNASGQAVAEPYWHAWKRICKAVVTIGDADLVQVTYTTAGTPVVTPTVSFAPTAIQNDPLVPTTQVGDDPERSDPTSVSASAPPTTYKATYGHWVNVPYYDPNGNTKIPYDVTLQGQRTNPSDSTKTMSVTYKTMPDTTTGDLCVWYVDPSNSSNNRMVFDIDNYNYPSTTDSNYLKYKNYGVGPISPAAGDPVFQYVPGLNFLVDTTKGVVNCAFPHVDLTVSSNLSSLGATSGNTAASFSVSTSDLNNIYQNATVAEAAHRFFVFNYLNSWTQSYLTTPPPTPLLNNSTVAPGLERVVGPDCNPGQSFGKPVQYTRVPFWNVNTDPGLNQYKMDTKYNDGTVSGAAMYFMSNQNYTTGGSDVQLPTSSMYGTMSLSYNPLSYIYVLYFEQNNQIGDSLSANYVTKELVTVTMGVQIYDATDGKAQSLQLTNKIKLRNIAS